MAVTLLNAFIVPKDREEEFLATWTETATYFSAHPGFIETHLHRNTNAGNPTFSFINIARWTSAEAWKSTHDAYRPKEYDIPGVKGHASIFDCVVDMYPAGGVLPTAETGFIREGFFKAAE